MSVELIPLCNVSVQLKVPIMLFNTPVGARLVFEVESARIEGERLSGSMLGVAAADWLAMGPDGTGTLDVRFTFQTDDGAVVFVHYTGRTDLRGFPEPAPVYVAPLFETGDERYAWLNRIQALGKGLLDGQALTYEWYELR